MRFLLPAICIAIALLAPTETSARWRHHGEGQRRERDYLPRIRYYEPRYGASPREPCGLEPRDARGRLSRCKAARSAFERENPCPSTGEPTGPCPGYIVDHVIALKRGGADDPSNMQWQTIADAKAKDKVE